MTPSGLEKIQSPEPLKRYQVAIPLITKYPHWYEGPLIDVGDTDKVRGDLALETIKAACARGYTPFVADASYDEGVGLSGLFKILLSEQETIISERQHTDRTLAGIQVIKDAAQWPAIEQIVFTQPEKVDLINHLPLITAELVNGRADIVVPKRQKDLFQMHYPEYMFESEEKGNKELDQMLRDSGLLSPDMPDFDYFFGVWAMRNDPTLRRDILSAYTVYNEQIEGYFSVSGTASTYFPILEALHKGYKVASVEVPFVYPETQRVNETIPANIDTFKKKRQNQLKGIITEVKEYIRYIETL